jgi:NADH-quinone oxidoreductase subunit A
VETGFITAFWFLIIAAATTPLMLGVGYLVRPRGTQTSKKMGAYECGEEPVGSAWVKFNIRFYVVAIIFIIFDVEVAAVFPAAAVYKESLTNGNVGLVFMELFLFIGLLLAGLLYCWVRGDLEWVKGVSGVAPKHTT